VLLRDGSRCCSFLIPWGRFPSNVQFTVNSERMNGIPSSLSTEACRPAFWRSPFARCGAILTRRRRGGRWYYADLGLESWRLASGTITDEAHRWVDERAEFRELVYSAATSLEQPVDGYLSLQSGFAGGICANKGWMYVATNAVGSL
jgi:hypothetical protein